MIFTNILKEEMSKLKIQADMLEETAYWFARMCDRMEIAAGSKFEDSSSDFYDKDDDFYDRKEARDIASMELHLGEQTFTFGEGEDQFEDKFGRVVILIHKLYRPVPAHNERFVEDYVRKNIETMPLGLQIMVTIPTKTTDDSVTYEPINRFRLYMKKFKEYKGLTFMEKHDLMNDSEILKETAVKNPETGMSEWILERANDNILYDGSDNIPEDILETFEDIMEVIRDTYMSL